MRAFVIVIILACISCSSSSAEVLSPAAQPGAIIQFNTKPWASPDRNASDEHPGNLVPQPDDIPEETVELDIKPERSQASDMQVFIKDILVEGVTLLPQALLEKEIAPYRNKMLSFSKLQKLADTLTDLYRQLGYINSQIYIPPQDLENGVLVLKALEGKIGNVYLETDRWFGKRAITPRLDLEEGNPLNAHSLLRRIRLINENPDLKMRVSLARGEMAGTSDIRLKAEDAFPVHLTPFWDNLGRDSIGISRFGLALTHNNLLGLGDSNTSTVSFTKRSFGVVNQYLLPLGPYGTQIGMDYAYSRVKLGGVFEPLDIQSSAHIYSPLLRQNLLKTDRLSLSAELAFDFKDISTDLLDLPFYRDRLRVLRPSLSASFQDAWGRTHLNQEFGIGLDILGATNGNSATASKVGSGAQFFRMSGSATRIQRLPWKTTALLRARYQYSPDRLLSTEQFQLGGAYTVRGYPEGLEIGDRGYVLNAEWYAPIPFIPEKIRLPFLKDAVKHNTNLVSFIDFGQLYTNRPVEGETRRASLLGCGVGLRVQLTRFLVGRMDVGFPILKREDGSYKPRLNFGLQSPLF